MDDDKATALHFLEIKFLAFDASQKVFDASRRSPFKTPELVLLSAGLIQHKCLMRLEGGAREVGIPSAIARLDNYTLITNTT